MERMAASARTTLNEARRWLRERLRQPGAVACPCCEQIAKVYKRPLNGAMATFLIRAYRVNGQEFFHVPTFNGEDRVTQRAMGVSGYYSMLRYWGFIEEEPTRRPDGGRAGWWRVTDAGAAFVRMETSVQKYILLYDSRLLGFEGEEVMLPDVLGRRFNYNELMAS